MYSDKIRLVKETFYRQAILFLIIAAGYVVVGFFTCMKYDDGLQVFLLLCTSINITSLIVLFLLLLAGIYYFRYKYNTKRRRAILECGVKYPGEIINTFTVKNWFGQGRARYFKMVIRYDGNKEFITQAYDSDPEYMITTNSCSVYVFNGKEYAADFKVIKKGKNDISRSSGVNEEDYLFSNISPENFNRKEFIEGRVAIVLDMSDKYLMPMPGAAVFNDGVTKSVVIDIAIDSPKKVKLFSGFEEELNEYIKSISKEMSSGQIEEFNESVKKKLKELLRTYYYFVKIKSIDVGEI